MPISLTCSGCSAKLSAPDAAAGKSVKCPKCRRALTVTAVPTFEVVDDPSESASARVTNETSTARPADRAAPGPRRDPARDTEEDGSRTKNRPPTGRTKRRNPDEDTDEQSPPRSNATGTVFAPRNILIGLLLIAVVTLAGVVIADRLGGPSDTASVPKVDPPAQPGPNVPAPKPNGPQPAPATNSNLGPDGAPRMPPEIDALFAAPASRIPPTLRPVLVPQRGADFETPSVTTTKAPAVPEKRTIEQLKKAIVFVKVTAGERSGSGSGFVVRTHRDFGLIATNTHVISEAFRDRLLQGASFGRGEEAAKIDVVFNSGLTGEKTLRASLVAADPERDLALLRVADLPAGVAAIEPVGVPAPTETLPVLICGFPFGQQLAEGVTNPSITIGKGSVSSLRTSATGRLTTVQIDGSINPGNSGGPIVDAEGRLVGVAVATIRGSGIGMAIPAADLAAVLDGRVASPVFAPRASAPGTARFHALVPIADPNRRVRSVSLLVAGPKAAAETGEGGTWKPLVGATRVDLKILPIGVGVADLDLPTATGGATVQMSCTYATGEKTVSRPVPFALKLEEISTPGEGVPVGELNSTPERYEGQVVSVRVDLMVGGMHSYSRTYELTVWNPENREARPNKLRFLASSDVRLQLDETPKGTQEVVVQMSCLVGKKGANGITPLRVLTVDLVAADGRITKKLPYLPMDVAGQLRLNSDHFVGKTVTVELQMSGSVGVRGSTSDIELDVRLPSGRRTLSLLFRAPGRFADPIRQAVTQTSLTTARLTGRVEAETHPGMGARYITLSRIELLDQQGSVVKTIE